VSLGLSVARRFGREGHSVGLIAREHSRIEALVGGLKANGVRVAAR
jgi:NADP-dependent 3-hydroxy acid dehydrogenase YdfG